MVSGFFGVPGCGKTTFLTKFAQKELRRIKKGKSPYTHVLTNFYCKGCDQVTVSQLGHYDITKCLILLDELTLDVDSRDYKSFSTALKEFFVLHRHDEVDVIYFVQDWERVDKTIRNVTFDLWYVSKSVIPFIRNWSVAKRVYRNFDVNEYSSELIYGYRFPKLLEVIFSSPKQICFRPAWYRYFDTLDKSSQSIERSPFQYISWDA